MLEEAGKESVVEARAALREFVASLKPLLRETSGDLHALLDRFEIDIHIKLNPRSGGPRENSPTGNQ